jgi:hypothetical protein
MEAGLFWISVWRGVASDFNASIDARGHVLKPPFLTTKSKGDTMARRVVRGFIAAGVGVVATLAFLAFATPAAAQQGVTTGAINGQVLDTSGAPLAGATVTIRNVDTGASARPENCRPARPAATARASCRPVVITL